MAGDVREALLSNPGVFDVSVSFDSPRDELVLELNRRPKHWVWGWRMWRGK